VEIRPDLQLLATTFQSAGDGTADPSAAMTALNQLHRLPQQALRHHRAPQQRGRDRLTALTTPLAAPAGSEGTQRGES